MSRRRSPNPRDAVALDRREFLANATVAAMAGAHVIAAPSILGAEQPNASAVVEWQKAPCRLCGVGCGVLVGIERGRAVAVKGDPQSPVSDGLACVKGYHAAQGLYGADRVTRALVRREGRLMPVPLTAAYDVVARRLRDTIARHGKDSVAMYGSAQWTITDAYIAAKLFKGALGSNNVDTSASLDGASAAAALEAAYGDRAGTGCHEDVDHADVFVLWDVNLAETDPVLFSRMLERRRINPAVRVVELSTRATRTTYAADHSLPFVPGSERAIAEALCHELHARERTNRAFVERYVTFRAERPRSSTTAPAAGRLTADAGETATLKDFAKHLAGYTPEHAAQVSGVAADRIRWLASLYGDPTRRVLSLSGTSLNQRPGALATNSALHNLHLLVGKVAAPGNGVLHLPGRTGIAVGFEAGAQPRTLPWGTVDDGKARARAAQIWGIAPDRIDPAPGRDALAMLRAFQRGEIRFLWIQATNPMAGMPDLSGYRPAAGDGDRFLVVSEAYPTATTREADVVLPAAMWLEREGVIVNGERRAQHFARMVRPPGDATSDGWQLVEVARRLGFSALFPKDAASHVEEAWEEYRRFHASPGGELPSLSVLRARAGVIAPFVAGREVRWRYNVAHDLAADRALGAYDFHGNPDHRARIWLRPAASDGEAPDAAYPMRLHVGAVLEHTGTGTVTRRIPPLRRAMPAAYAELNREDAARLGIRDGDRVRVLSRRGRVETVARIERRSQPHRGSVFIPWFDDEVAVGALLPDARSPVTGQPEIGACAVRVERIGAGAGAGVGVGAGGDA